ncbi:MAG: hypothetical protein IPO92_15725 [Saprospiraceae bacterium]|nr:hypothetical protein [Saprospiraceae bacterium]
MTRYQKARSVDMIFIIGQTIFFNETTYLDSGKVMFYKLDNSLRGFGLHANQIDVEYLYDGNNFEKLKHKEKLRVIFDTFAIRNDQDYFFSFPFCKWNPVKLLSKSDFAYVFDTIMNSTKYYVFKKENKQKSKSDSTLIVTYIKLYFVSAADSKLDKMEEITIRGSDTLQLATHHFKNIFYERRPFYFEDLDSLKHLNYRNVSEENEFEEFKYIPIKVGAKLQKARYTDINGVSTAIFGNSGQMSLIMFSFIGCAACEQALKDFENENYNFKEGINVYYSSFQNVNAVLKSYINKKKLPFVSFGKESNMIEEFSCYFSPTFVLINSEGFVLNVLEGYDNEVKRVLFELLLQKQTKDR